jgi:hypothetical protein
MENIMGIANGGPSNIVKEETVEKTVLLNTCSPPNQPPAMVDDPNPYYFELVRIKHTPQVKNELTKRMLLRTFPIMKDWAIWVSLQRIATMPILMFVELNAGDAFEPRSKKLTINGHKFGSNTSSTTSAVLPNINQNLSI